ncbi:MAG: hypothetical protein ICV63_02885 [Coleofasciculus sp. Co-bin14]|nr:hypothetical protein [Coleofasciculus sp. Co-bin14]
MTRKAIAPPTTEIRRSQKINRRDREIPLTERGRGQKAGGRGNAFALCPRLLMSKAMKPISKSSIAKRTQRSEYLVTPNWEGFQSPSNWFPSAFCPLPSAFLKLSRQGLDQRARVTAERTQ